MARFQKLRDSRLRDRAPRTTWSRDATPRPRLDRRGAGARRRRDAGRDFVDGRRAAPRAPRSRAARRSSLADLDGDGDSTRSWPAASLRCSTERRRRFTRRVRGGGARLAMRRARGAVAGDYDNDGGPTCSSSAPAGRAPAQRGRRQVRGRDGRGRHPAAAARARRRASSTSTTTAISTSCSRGARPTAAPQQRQRHVHRRHARQAELGGGRGRAGGLVPTDFDNRRDVDLLVVARRRARALQEPARRQLPRRRGRGRASRRARTARCAAAGDVNKDGFTDFFFGRADGGACSR